MAAFYRYMLVYMVWRSEPSIIRCEHLDMEHRHHMGGESHNCVQTQYLRICCQIKEEYNEDTLVPLPIKLDWLHIPQKQYAVYQNKVYG